VLPQEDNYNQRKILECPFFNILSLFLFFKLKFRRIQTKTTFLIFEIFSHIIIIDDRVIFFRKNIYLKIDWLYFNEL